jgi:hypothetical protein
MALDMNSSDPIAIAPRVNVPYNAMTNRHDYPISPAGTCKALAVIQ